MNGAQHAVFQAGSGAAPGALLTGIASVALLDVAWSALRASIVLMVLGFYLR